MANKKNPFSEYYNYPKLYGEAPPEERWHSDKSEPGMVPPWMKSTRKDQFGFGTEQPISQEDMLKMERSKLDKLLSMGEITQDEYTDMYKQLQDNISKIEKKNESLLGRFIERQTSGTYYDIPSGETKRWEK